MNDTFQNLLNSEIDGIVKLWNNFHNESNKKKGYIYLENNWKNIKNVFEIIIKDYEIFYDKYVKKNINKKYPKEKRIDSFIDLLKNTIKFKKKNNYKISNIKIYLLLSDNANNKLDYKKKYKYPLLSYSRQKNSFRFLIPDRSFTNTNINDKKYNWDEVKKIIHNYCSNKETINKIYFKGKDSSKMRKNLDNTSKEKKNIIINLDKNKYIPLYKFCDYKYLLDLPGVGPWSYRFKEILAMPNSLTIKINLLKYNFETFNFFHKIIKPNIDYLVIDIDNEKIKDKKYIDELYKKLKKIMDENKNYKKIMDHSTKQMNKLTMKTVYLYIIKLLNEYSKLFNS